MLRLHVQIGDSNLGTIKIERVDDTRGEEGYALYRITAWYLTHTLLIAHDPRDGWKKLVISALKAIDLDERLGE